MKFYKRKNGCPNPKRCKKDDIFNIAKKYEKHPTVICMFNRRTKTIHIILKNNLEELSFIDIWELKRQNKWSR